MADRVLQRRDTSANWSSANPILAEGEMGIVTDTKGYKIGDGSTAWNDLEYPSNPTTVVNELGDSSTTAISQKITTDSILNRLDITNIDLDSSTISKLMFATAPTRYNVMSNNKNCGILEVFSDNNGHMLTEVFETHYIVEDGVLTSGHSDDKIFRYKREYHYNGGTSTIPVGTWGEWEMIYSSDNQNDIDTLKNDVENLNANTGISEYETFSDQKAYSAGDTVMYNGLLYTFTTDRAAGAWDESQVESASLKGEVENDVLEMSLNNIASENKFRCLGKFQTVKAILNTNGTWYTNSEYTKGIIISVHNNDIIKITASSSPCYYGIIKSLNIKNGENIDYANSTNRVTIPASGSKQITIPEEGNFLFINIAVTNIDEDFTPTYLSINGYDYSNDILQNVVILQNQMKEQDERIDNNFILSEISDNINLSIDNFNTLPFAVNSNGTWIASPNFPYAKGFALLVNGGDLVKIGAGQSTAYISFLKTISSDIYHGQNVDFAANESRHDIVSGNINVFTVPSDAKYIYVNISVSEENQNLSPQTLEINGYDYSSKITEKLSKRIFTLKKSGGNFNTVVSAFNSLKKGDTLEIYEGEYNVLDELGGEDYISENPTGKGIYIPDGITIVGVGSKSKIIISSEVDISDDAHNTFASEFSTLNLQGSVTIENITIKGKSVRYVLHDESGGTVINGYRKYINVDFIYQKDSTLPNIGGAAYGWGASSGQNLYAKNCRFIGFKTYSFLCHDNNNFLKPVQIEFENCFFITNYENENNRYRGIKLSCYLNNDNNVRNVAILNGCVVDGITIRKETVDVGLRWDILGQGNTPCPIYISETEYETPTLIFSDEFITGINKSSSPLTKGMPIKFIDGGIDAITNDSENYKFIGILMNNVSIGEIALVKSKGFISFNDVNIVSANIGDKIGIQNGLFTTVDSNDFIGVAITGIDNSKTYGQGFLLK